MGAGEAAKGQGHSRRRRRQWATALQTVAQGPQNDAVCRRRRVELTPLSERRLQRGVLAAARWAPCLLLRTTQARGPDDVGRWWRCRRRRPAQPLTVTHSRQWCRQPAAGSGVAARSPAQPSRRCRETPPVAARQPSSQAPPNKYPQPLPFRPMTMSTKHPRRPNCQTSGGDTLAIYIHKCRVYTLASPSACVRKPDPDYD